MSKTATATKPTSKPTLVHESEVQRQHVRIHLPAAVKIDKQTWKIADLSAGGFSIHTDSKFAPSKNAEEVRILFPFESFAFHLKVKAVPVYHNREKSIVGYRFQETSQRQASLLNHIIKSYLAGLLTSEQDLIAIAARGDHVLAREDMAGNDNNPGGKVARILPMMAIGMAFALGAFILFGNIYEKTAIVKSYMARVEGNSLSARARASGDFYSLLARGTEQVTKDQPIGVIKNGGAATGDGMVINSPCDCLLVGEYAQDGEYVAAGDKLFDLQPVGDDLWVTASLPPEQVHRLHLQDDARIRVAGETKFIEGNVTEFLPPSLDSNVARVRIRTQEPIPYFLAGRLAYVEFQVN